MNISDPRFRATIPSSATTMRYTPSTLDPLGAFNRRLPLLEADAADAERAHNELVEQQRVGTIVGTHASDMIAEAWSKKIDLFAKVSNERRKAEEAFAEIGLPPTFIIKVPTAVEREQINVRLVQMGLTSVSDEQLRASLIETLYEVKWSVELENPEINDEAHADELAALLDGFWQQEIIQGQAFAQWRSQELERSLDEMSGAPARPAEPTPPRIISVRQEAQVRILTDRLMEEPRMRRIIAKRLDFARRNAVIIVRMNLVGVEGLDVELIHEPLMNVLTEDSVNALRNAIDARFGKQRGNDAWVELVGHIDLLYSLDEFERGNSDSPLGKPLDQTGSIAPSGATAISDGSSMASTIAAPPVAEFVTITGSAFASTSECEEANKSDGPTDAA